MPIIYTQVSPDYFKDVLRYFIEICGKANETSTDELDKALALWVQSVPEQAQEDIMTFAQQLEKRGEERGKQQGMQQGMQQGEKKASLKIAKQLLDSHVDRVPW